MARDRGARYPNAAELAADLRRFTNGQLVKAHRYDRRTLVKRWLRRNRAAVTVGVVLFAVLVVVGVVSVQRILDERDTAERNQREAELRTQEARESLAQALVQKGKFAEQQQRWRDAAVY